MAQILEIETACVLRAFCAVQGRAGQGDKRAVSSLDIPYG